MKRDIAEKWVAALRSGDYTQARGYLKLAHGHCCLGVLCELAVKENVVKGAMKYDYQSTRYLFCFGANEEVGHLPEEVLDWSGIKTGNGELKDILSLSMYNDAGKSFDEISGLIEKYSEHL